MKHWWRVTRFDPTKRDSRGAYQSETWTSISEVGNEYDGSVLKESEYLRAEDAYLESFELFARESQIDELQVRDLEGGGDLSEGQLKDGIKPGVVQNTGNNHG